MPLPIVDDVRSFLGQPAGEAADDAQIQSHLDTATATVRAYVREHLARYKVPRDVTFVDELPRNPTGKILKRELAGSS